MKYLIVLSLLLSSSSYSCTMDESFSISLDTILKVVFLYISFFLVMRLKPILFILPLSLVVFFIYDLKNKSIISVAFSKACPSEISDQSILLLYLSSLLIGFIGLYFRKKSK